MAKKEKDTLQIGWIEPSAQSVHVLCVTVAGRFGEGATMLDGLLAVPGSRTNIKNIIFLCLKSMRNQKQIVHTYLSLWFESYVKMEHDWLQN